MSYENLTNAVILGNAKSVKEHVESLLAQKNDPLEIIHQGLIAGMNVIGTRFKNGKCSYQRY